MMMPGRKYIAGSGYRYGFNGQEKSDDVIQGNYTAEYWEYDSRIGRRWNVDPKPKEYESPYAVMGNNPIWNMDPNGADTIKAISNAQLVDALKIASNEVKNVISSKEKYFTDAVKGRLLDAATNYWEQHQKEMNFGGFAGKKLKKMEAMFLLKHIRKLAIITGLIISILLKEVYLHCTFRLALM
jgi:RHS repeat-associated protein